MGNSAVLCRAAATRGTCASILDRGGFHRPEAGRAGVGRQLVLRARLTAGSEAWSRPRAGATIFAYQVRDPERYGVVSFDAAGTAIRIEEKPAHTGSNWAITGLYFFDNDVVRYAAGIRPSYRGELEITDVHNCYLAAGALHVEKMGRGFAWLDTGTFESLIDAASFVQTLEQRQGMKIACPEEIAYRMGFIRRSQLIQSAQSLNRSGYGEYLLQIADSDRMDI